MSSMRNAVQRRNHRERAQPLEREKWGILEKHKDYGLRAKDYNEKKKRLEILRKKAAERNPDEFHFGMSRSKAHDKGQKVADRGNPVLSHDAVKLLKTQDAGYLKTIAQTTRKARERLEQEVLIQRNDAVFLERESKQGGSGRHLVFVNSMEEQKQFKQAAVDSSMSNDVEDDEERPPQRQQRDRTKEELSTLKKERILRKLRKRGQEARLSRLKLLKLREKELMTAEQELEIQRAKMNNSIGGVNKAGVKWKIRERKK